MKNSADLGGCYPPRLKAEVDDTLRDLQNSSYFIHTEIYTRRKAHVKFVQNSHSTKQKGKLLWKYIVRPIRDMNDRTSQWRATSGRLSVKQNGRRGAKIFFKRTIDDFVDGQENKNTRAKTDGDVGLLKPFLQREVELRNIEKYLLINSMNCWASSYSLSEAKMEITTRQHHGCGKDICVWPSSSDEH